MKLALLLLASYLLGSIPFGFMIGLLVGIDIRKVGSGNIGFTNVLRTLGLKLALVVLIFDAGKGFIPVWVTQSWELSEYFVIIAGLLAILGHSFPVWLGFRGGRGVATGFGVMIGISYSAAGLCLLIWLLVLGLTRYVSVSSTCAAIVVPVLLILFHQSPVYIVFGALVAVLIIIRHIPNYRRLIQGIEPKIGQ